MVSVQRIIKPFLVLAFANFLLVGCGGAPGGSASGGDLVATISFESAEPEDLTLAGQGGAEASVVRFKVADQFGVALRGVGVTFSLSDDVGGAFMSTTKATSDSSGVVSTVVRSGSAPVAVFVSARIEGTQIQAYSNEISISTSSFIASSFNIGVIVSETVTSMPGSPANYYVNPIQQTKSGSMLIGSAGELGGVEATLQMIVTDQFGHKVRDGARITVVSPVSGLVRPSTCVLEDGICQVSWVSVNSANVGDQIIILAYASGAEAFEDMNGNNVFDPGEPFVDYHEAFADENFNGVYDPGEFFVDANNNEVWDAVGNGVWDGPCISGDCDGEESTIIWDAVVLTLDACPIDGCATN